MNLWVELLLRCLLLNISARVTGLPDWSKADLPLFEFSFYLFSPSPLPLGVSYDVDGFGYICNYYYFIDVSNDIFWWPPYSYYGTLRLFPLGVIKLLLTLNLWPIINWGFILIFGSSDVIKSAFPFFKTLFNPWR
jgi:hypothetical protein